jgi:fructose-bisphosphate aldolase class I
MTDELWATAQKLVSPKKGILAIDETVGTATKRFAAHGIDSTPESRRDFRELLVSTPGAGEFISGAILYDETLQQETEDGRPFPDILTSAGILPGIKVDTGAKPLAKAPGETITEGLDNLRARLEAYRGLGARFTKWRAVLSIGDGLPSTYCIRANAHALGRYAALAQECGLVPIVEPEVLMDGNHDLDRSEDVTRRVLDAVFSELEEQRCELEAMILKPNMVTPGSHFPERAPSTLVAERTVGTLLRFVPPTVPGIAFLSGGQSGEEACDNLNAIAASGALPWAVTFSFGRALQHPALEIWAGERSNASAAQAAFLHRLRMSSRARSGEYAPEMERMAA